MATAFITKRLISQLKPKEREYDVRDERLKGFLIRVQPTGSMSYVVQYARGKRITLGKVGVLTPMEARKKAMKIIGNYAVGLNPEQAKIAEQGVPTLQEFLDEKYAPWVKTHNMSGDEAVKSIYRHFLHLLHLPIDQIELKEVEAWRTEKLKSKTMKVNTINRTITPLRSAVAQAVKWGIIKQNPLINLKTLKHDDTRIRYLSEDERSRLFEALEAREEKLKVERKNGNEWRKSRGYDLYPEIKEDEYANYLLPMVILALNTGIRKSELLQLKRSHINLAQGNLFIEKSKNHSSRHIPLNESASGALKTWMRQTEPLNSLYLFPNPTNPDKPIVSVKKAWINVVSDAGIEDLRWHDLRHDFASCLVMCGVSLYAVQRLLGHKKLEQTMKYAHLAPDFMAESVMKIDRI